MCNLKCKCLKNDSSMQVELKSRVCSVESCLDSNCGVYSAKCGAYSGVKHSVKCSLCEPHLPILTMR